MRLRRQISRHWLGGLVGTLLAVVAGVGLRFVHFGNDVPVGRGFIEWSYDLLFSFRAIREQSGG